MRQLVIICESSHAHLVEGAVKTFCHPALARFVSVIAVDVGAGGPFKGELDRLISLARNDLEGTSQPPLVCHTREAGSALKVKNLATALGFDTKIESLSQLTKIQNGDNSPVPMQSRLNECGLSLRGGAVELLQHWSHAKVDRNGVDAWLNQFGQLGKAYAWIGEAILASISLVPAADLGELFGQIALPTGATICINRDPRTTAKSGDVISNLLTKRHNGVTIHTSPASAIEDHGARSVVVFEDGLWSGTEALGIIESLLGLREPHRMKTQSLKDSSLLANVDLVFAYGVATDYGAAMVEYFLRENGLRNVRIAAAHKIEVAPASVLEQLKSGSVNFDEWREKGPTGGIPPHVFATFAARGVSAAQIEEAKQFCAAIGTQLFEQYLLAQAAVRKWDPWPPEKIARASVGMHGLGMVHAFAHSVPKATLPLLWQGGKVTLNGRTVNWVPLFKNS